MTKTGLSLFFILAKNQGSVAAVAKLEKTKKSGDFCQIAKYRGQSMVKSILIYLK